MLGKELLAYVDHTLLRPTATWDDIKEVCEDGIRYKTASVCIPPDFVASAHEAYPELNICTVIGFPLGYETTEVKVNRLLKRALLKLIWLLILEM